MTISAQLLANKCAELAQRLGIPAGDVTTAQGRGTEIRAPISVDGRTLSQNIALVFPFVGVFDRRADGAHHLIRIYDLKRED